MTRTEAREYFRQTGLAYSDITVSDLRLLCVLLERQFAFHRKERIETGGRVCWVRMNCAPRFNGQFDENGRLRCAFLDGKGEYFTIHEVISFELDGFIGFCCGMDAKNAEPVLAAFVEWCDIMAELKTIGERGEDG